MRPQKGQKCQRTDIGRNHQWEGDKYPPEAPKRQSSMFNEERLSGPDTTSYHRRKDCIHDGVLAECPEQSTIDLRHPADGCISTIDGVYRWE